MRGNWVAIALALTVIAGISAFAAWRFRRGASTEVCDVCRRPIHGESKTVAEFAGRREAFCCPACALSAHRQTGRAVRVLELRDYDTRVALAPQGAYVVRGSDVNPCAHRHVVADASGRPGDERFDRCSPSILAFATRSAAASFAASHGGTLLPFGELSAAYR